MDDGTERGPCGIWTDRNAQQEDMEEDQTVPLPIRHRGKRPINRIGKTSGFRLECDRNGEVARFASR